MVALGALLSGAASVASLAGKSISAFISKPRSQATPTKRLPSTKTSIGVATSAGSSPWYSGLGQSISGLVSGISGAMPAVQTTLGFAKPKAKRRRYRFRIRKGVKQRWNSKYRGWENVPRRGKAKKPAAEIASLKSEIDNLKMMVMMSK